MADENMYLSTPAEYATAAQIAQARAQAAFLLKQAEESPVRHWTQGVANMARALVGGYDSYRTGEREKLSREYDANKISDEWEKGRAGNKPVTVAPSTPSVVPKSAEIPASARSMASALAVPGGVQPAVSVKPAEGSPSGIINTAFGELNKASTGPDAIVDAIGPSNYVSPARMEPAATAAALRGGAPVSPNIPPRAPVVPPSPSEGVAPPASTFPTRPSMSKEGLRTALRSTWLPPNIVDATANMYLGQDSPVTVDTATGTWTRGKDGQVYFTPKQEKDTVKGHGGTEVPRRLRGTPTGGWEVVPLGEASAPGAKAAPPPAAAPVEPPAPIEPLIPSNPKRGAALPEAGKTAAAPMDMRELSAAKRMPGEVPPEAAPPPAGMLGVQPPAAEPASNVIPAAVEPSGERTAQIDPNSRRILDELDKRGLDYEREQKDQTADITSRRKLVDEATSLGRKALTYMPELEMARDLIKNPNFTNGTMVGLQDAIQRFKSTFGIDPKASAPAEIFDKIMSRAILNDLRLSLGGLGQVRVAEIDLLKQATANRTMSKEGMAHVIDMMTRLHKDAIQIGNVTKGYEQGYRLNDKGQWITDRNGDKVRVSEAPTYIGLTEQLDRYARNNPLMTKEEMAKLSGDLMPSEKKAEPAQKRGQRPVVVQPPAPKSYGPTPPPGYQ